MSTKRTFQQPKVHFVYRVERQAVPALVPDGKETFQNQPVGVAHLFRVYGRTQAESAFCGHVFPSGMSVEAAETKPAGLPLCPACESGWKKAPDSPWQKWAAPVVVLILLISLACLTPTAAMVPASPEPSRAPTRTAEAEPTAERGTAPECVRVLGDSLYIRDAPDYETGAVVAYLHGGEVVRVLDRANGWVLTRQGWSNAAWVEVVACP
ncbi:MAG: SH3 domain-containing protein [Chloroflexi bacterium]|nr:SH3 domain-containing protein [Chloroflexota bacterium]